MPHSKKSLKPTDLITFPWEQETKRTAEITAADRAALIQRIKERDSKKVVSMKEGVSEIMK
jgi:hypothetical protein